MRVNKPSLIFRGAHGGEVARVQLRKNDSGSVYTQVGDASGERVRGTALYDAFAMARHTGRLACCETALRYALGHEVASQITAMETAS
jgi:hypothetical protein